MHAYIPAMKFYYKMEVFLKSQSLDLGWDFFMKIKIYFWI